MILWSHANIKTERKLAQTFDHAFAFNVMLKFQKICTNPQTGINFDEIVPESVCWTKPSVKGVCSSDCHLGWFIPIDSTTWNLALT